ncbi:MAG: transposase family protein [Deltaproteobacteria bacterium]|jgi:hypothetical protein|nr:transposase family protein [Deltaproteobacteria bacterium]
MDQITIDVMKPKINPVYLDFEKIYEVPFPIYIHNMDFSNDSGRVDIHLLYHKRATFTCPCGKENLKVHSKLPRIWRGLDIAKYGCYIHLDVPRLICPECGVRTYQVPWARDHSHLTHLMEQNILTLSNYMPIGILAKFLGESENRVSNVLTHFAISPKVPATRGRKKRTSPVEKSAPKMVPAAEEE